MKHGETEGRVQTEDEDTASQPSVLDPYMSHTDNDYSDYSVVWTMATETVIWSFDVKNSTWTSGASVWWCQ